MKLDLSLRNAVQIRALANETRASARKFFYDDVMDVTALARANGFSVFERKTPENIESFIVVRDSEPIKPFNANRVIAVREGSPSKKQRLCIAHELGHFFMHKKASTNMIKAARYIADSKELVRLTDDEVLAEEQADLFARVLLMPAGLYIAALTDLRKEDDTGVCLKKLAEKFWVTTKKAAQRIFDKDDAIVAFDAGQLSFKQKVHEWLKKEYPADSRARNVSYDVDAAISELLQKVQSAEAKA